MLRLLLNHDDDDGVNNIKFPSLQNNLIITHFAGFCEKRERKLTEEKS